MPETPNQTQSTITIEDVRDAVDSAFIERDQSESERYDNLVLLVGDVGSRVDSVSDALGSVSRADGVVYEVRATSSQVETAKSALRVLCTEGLVLIVVTSIGVGLLAWRAFTARFIRG